MNTNFTHLTFSVFMLFFLSSCGQTPTKNQTRPSIASSHIIDTSKYSILTFDTTDTWLFENAKPDSLTQNEIVEIENILKQCIDAYNPNEQIHFDTISKVHPGYNLKVDNFVINLSRYKRQYLPVINSAGQKEVWVNCFCNDFKKNWKTEMLIVKDGGNCYFSLTVNLSTKTFSGFIVNGDA